MPDPDQEDDERDKAILVYRLNCPINGGSARVRVEFEHLAEIHSLRVS